eukprot:gene6485-7150_t
MIYSVCFLALLLCVVYKIVDAYQYQRPILLSSSTSLKANLLPYDHDVQEIHEKPPRWAGGGLVSSAVNALLSYKPLFNIMRQAARKRIISKAERYGIPWRQNVQTLRDQEDVIQEYFNQIENPYLFYPFYYRNEFHAYDTGNLEFLCAYEGESATYTTALHVFADSTGPEAHAKMRAGLTQTLLSYLQKYRSKVRSMEKVLDVACSIGMSTQALVEALPSSKEVIGLELSPHFLSVAKYRQEKEGKVDRRVKWTHQNIEHTNYAAQTFDLVASSFLFHELPTDAAMNALQEAYRILQPKGVFVMMDMNPHSDAAKNMDPVGFTVLKATEPFTDQYFTLDFARAMKKVGFVDVEEVATDARHRVLIGRKA